MDFEKIYRSIRLSPGERITIEINGARVEMTAQGLTIEGCKKKSDALSIALAAVKISKELRNKLVAPICGEDEIKKLAEDLIHAGEYLKRWADQ